jgi:hypothetical protein
VVQVFLDLKVLQVISVLKEVLDQQVLKAPQVK